MEIRLQRRNSYSIKNHIQYIFTVSEFTYFKYIEAIWYAII